jgi:hypothetical protein
MARVPAFQAGYAGSIPVTRSKPLLTRAYVPSVAEAGTLEKPSGKDSRHSFNEAGYLAVVLEVFLEVQ